MSFFIDCMFQALKNLCFTQFTPFSKYSLSFTSLQSVFVPFQVIKK
ncbi:hypothetical protein B4146_2146 [Bacillus subtilis]|uniref:Uncharacterized protein n=1 Tax=Bacillus subtilis TaxID=1423 RepID=A0AAP1HCM0_BACIU|nr:hypothetical protein B4146_2146 [Bacillus subtilis]KZD95345.1 hypothetical protein B4122_0317 [Bacillus subtilis]